MKKSLMGVLRLTGRQEDERILSQNPVAWSEDLPLFIYGWLFIAFLAVFVIMRWESPVRQAYTVGLLLLFSILYWIIPRRNARQMHRYLMVQTVVATAAFQDPLFIVLFCILALQATMTLSFRSCAIWIVFFILITIAWNSYRVLTDLHHFRILSGSGVFILFIFISNLVSKLRRSHDKSERMLDELAAAYHRLEDYAEQDEYLAVSEERNRLSQQVHDSVGHKLTTSIVQLEGASRLIERNAEGAGGMIENARAQLVEGLEEMRQTLRALQNPKDNGNVLTRSLQRVSDEFAFGDGIAVHCQLPEALPPLSDLQNVTIYQAVQQALIETRRHGQASNVWMTLDAPSEGPLILTVRNNGGAFDASGGSEGGWQGLRERVAEVDGKLQTARSAEGGGEMVLQLPIWV